MILATYMILVLGLILCTIAYIDSNFGVDKLSASRGMKICLFAILSLIIISKL